MYGDQWWGYLHDDGVVTVSRHAPPQYRLQQVYSLAASARPKFRAVVKVVGPFTEDLADEFEGDQKMVRRKIMAALHEKPLEEIT